MNSSIEEAILVLDIANQDELFACATKLCIFFENNIDESRVKRAIIERERLGDTYIGNHQLMIHIVDKKIMHNFIVYSKLENPIYWKSYNSKKKYDINKIIFLGFDTNKVRNTRPKYLTKVYEFPEVLDELTKKLKISEIKVLE